MQMIEKATSVALEEEMTDFETLDFIRIGGETKRYHAWPVLKEQNVAEHSCHVAMLCVWLAKMDKVKLTSDLLMAALTHDWAEQRFGDLPAPTKRNLPSYIVDGNSVTFRSVWNQMELQELNQYGLEFESSLTRAEAYILGVADLADGCLYCIKERAMGNKLITTVYQNFRLALTNFSETYGAGVLEDYIDNKWRKACG